MSDETKPPPGDNPPTIVPPPVDGAVSRKHAKKDPAITTPGQVVAFLLALAMSVIWWRMRPQSPLGGAGGAIFPVLIVITILYFSAAWLGPLLDEGVFDRKNARKLRADRVGRPFLKEVQRVRQVREKHLSEGQR